MRRLMLLVLFLAVASILQAVPYRTPLSFMEVPLATSLMIMDGLDSESCWSEAQDLTPFVTAGWEGNADMSAYFKVCWDSSFLYIYANITDDYNHSLADPGNADPWMFDNFEVYLDLDTNNSSTDYDEHTVQLRFNRGIDYAYNAGHASSTDFIFHSHEKSGGDGWILEIAIPWLSALPQGSLPEDINAYIGNIMGFDVMVADSDNFDGDYSVGNRDAMAAWDTDGLGGDEDLAWNNTSVFGIIELLTSPPLPAIPFVEPVRTAEIPARTEKINFDGVADEAFWSAEQNTVVFNDAGWTGNSDLSANLRFAWDMNYFFLFADVTDDIAHYWDDSYAEPWMFDGIEIYFDLDTVMGYTEYDANSAFLRFSPGESGFNETGRANADEFLYYTEQKSTGDGWLLEAAIPWTAALPEGSPSENIQYYLNNSMGIDVNISDSDNSDGNPATGNRDAQASWDTDLPDGDLTEDQAWNNTHVLGVVDLTGTPEGPEPVLEGKAYIQPIMQVDVPARMGDFIADGLNTELFWSYPQTLKIYNDASYTGKDDFSMQYQAAWDTDNLYLHASITDDMEKSWYSGANLETEIFDKIQLFIDLDTFALETKYRENSTAMLEFVRGYNEVSERGRAEAGDFQYAWLNTENGWSLEVAIPWNAALPSGASLSTLSDYLPVIGFEVNAVDADNESSSNILDYTLAAWDADNTADEDPLSPLEELVTSNTRTFGLAHLSSYILDIDGAQSEPGVDLFPNPASTEVTILNTSSVENIRLLDMQGRVLYSASQPDGNITIDLTAYGAGLYLCTFQHKDGTVQSKYLVIQ